MSGAGKGFLGEDMLRKLLGTCYDLVNDPDQLTARFNGHLANKLLVHLDEAFFSGDPRTRSKIKTLAASPTIKVELKGRETFDVENCMRLFITTNADWCAPVERGDRRYFILDVSTCTRTIQSTSTQSSTSLRRAGTSVFCGNSFKRRSAATGTAFP